MYVGGIKRNVQVENQIDLLLEENSKVRQNKEIITEGYK
jgi:hypothetical protein